MGQWVFWECREGSWEEAIFGRKLIVREEGRHALGE
jgi:hypothetical protein